MVHIEGRGKGGIGLCHTPPEDVPCWLVFHPTVLNNPLSWHGREDERMAGWMGEDKKKETQGREQKVLGFRYRNGAISYSGTSLRHVGGVPTAGILLRLAGEEPVKAVVYNGHNASKLLVTCAVVRTTWFLFTPKTPSLHRILSFSLSAIR